MSPHNPLPGWHATDDELAVPVRTSSAPVAPTPDAHALDITHGAGDHIVLRHQDAALNPASMRLSAFLGVALVLGAIGFHFGFGNLFGDLTGGNDTTTIVEITPDGVFSPDAITLSPGDTLTLENKNPDPQVIKSTDGRELFAVQVLFETPFTFTVPDDASDTYTYFSETLPDDKTLTITIIERPVSGDASSSEDSEIPLPPESEEIPIPFDETPAMTVSSEASSSVPAVTIQKTEHTDETATISLGDSGFTQSVSSASSFTSQVPTNPYTVTSGLEKQDRLEAIAAAAKDAQGLHSGAPLQEIVKHKPTAVTQTGPQGMLLLVLPAFMGVAILFRKLTVA